MYQRPFTKILFLLGVCCVSSVFSSTARSVWVDRWVKKKHVLVELKKGEEKKTRGGAETVWRKGKKTQEAEVYLILDVN